MIFAFSRRPYGRVSVVEGTFVLTNFWCLNFVPLIPHETHLVLARAPTGECTSVPIPANAASIVAAYARVWGGLLAVIALFVVAAAETAAERAGALGIFALAATVCAFGWFFVGRVSAEERARRLTYGQVTGVPIDPAWLPEERRQDLAVRLRAELGARAPSLARAEYRAPPENAWEAVAADPAVTDADFLKHALVLARIEWRDANGERKAALGRVGDDLWRRWSAVSGPAALAGGAAASRIEE